MAPKKAAAPRVALPGPKWVNLGQLDAPASGWNDTSIEVHVRDLARAAAPVGFELSKPKRNRAQNWSYAYCRSHADCSRTCRFQARRFRQSLVKISP